MDERVQARLPMTTPPSWPFAPRGRNVVTQEEVQSSLPCRPAPTTPIRCARLQDPCAGGAVQPRDRHERTIRDFQLAWLGPSENGMEMRGRLVLLDAARLAP